MLTTYEDAVSKGESVLLDADDLADIADYYQLMEQFDEANEAINLALELSPGALKPLVYMIHLALDGREFDTAEELLNDIIDKSETDYILIKGEIMLAKEEYEAVEAYYLEELEKLSADEHDDLIYDIVDTCSDYGLWDDMLKWVLRAYNTDTVIYKEMLAKTLHILGQYEKSGQLYEELVDINPFSDYYWSSLASIQYEIFNFSKSIESSEYAIAINPNSTEGLIVKANSLFQIENYEDAILFYRRYIDIIGDDEAAYMNLGLCLFNVERIDEAISAFEKGATIKRRFSDMEGEFYLQLAYVYTFKEDYSKAYTYINKAKDVIHTDPTKPLIAETLMFLSMKKYDEAQNALMEAYGISPKIERTSFKYLLALYDFGRTGMAYSLFKMFIRTYPNSSPDGHPFLARLSYDLKMEDEFMKYLKSACEHRNLHECHMALADIFPSDVHPSDYYKWALEHKDQLLNITS